MDTSNTIMQGVKDGKLVDESAKGNSQSKESRKPGSLDKDAFLQLLVAQMKYQDPLQPTSNTEYISQLATFSSLEEMQNLNATMRDSQAASLVGKQVIMRVVSETTGTTNRVTGNVDYIMRENGKTYLSINGDLYNIEDLESVVDSTYLDAIALAETFKEAVAKLPDVKDLTLDDKEKLEAVKKAFNAMNSYQQGFIDQDTIDRLAQLLQKMAEMEAAAGGDSSDTEKPGDTDGTDGTDGTEGTEKPGDKDESGGTEAGEGADE
ncbi:MAG: flagellar hook capping protein [Lachnospiraceae bacterium]|nr:flagellar hook capping protein [Lachnospiraceae bacterium]